MNITEFAIKNNVVTLSLLFVIVAAGLSGFGSLPRDDMPPFLVRVANVVTTFPGASPERMELLISNKIEEVCQEVPEVDYIQSESRTGISVVTIFIKDSESNLQPIFDKLRRKIDAVRNQLPSGTVSVSFNDEGLADVYGIILGLTADGFTYAELKEAADAIRDDLIKLPNAAKIKIVGAREERIYLDCDDARLAELGLTQQKLKNIISSTNIVFSGGDIEVDDERIILEPTGNFDLIEDIKKIIVSSGKGELVFLGDIVNIYRGYVEPQQSSVRIDGKPGLAIGVNLKKGGNIIELGKEIDARLEYYQTVFPWGFEIVRAAFQDEVVDDSVKNFLGNLYQAVGVVLLVMLVFLGLRTGLIVASLIPMAIVTTILLMSQSGLGLNQVSLASLIIALGMLVDNAIVVSESIMVKMEKGEKAIDAAIASAKELFMPLLISSLTTSAAFLAFYLAESVMGEIMGELFVVVSFALLSSWLLSMTLIPLLCFYFLKVKPRMEQDAQKPNRFQALYEKILLYNLQRSFRFLGCVVAVFVVALWLARFLPFIFFPDSERALVTVTVDLPLGSTIDKTEEVVTSIENYVIEDLLVGEDRTEGVVSFSSYIGEGAPKYDLGYTAPEALPSSAHILLNTSSAAVNQRIIDAVDGFIFQNLPEAKGKVKRLSSGGGGDNAIEIRIFGDDPEVLYRLVAETKAKLRSIEGTKNIRDSWGPRTKKIIVDIDQHRARRAGVTSQDIALSLQTALSGLETGQFREGDKVIPIVMRNNQIEDRRIQDLESMHVYAQQSGKNVPLKQVADLNIKWQAAKILRRDLTRTISVMCRLKSGYTAAEITDQLAPWLEEQAWPSNYTYELGGEAEESAKNMGAIADYLPLSFFIIVLLLIGQFNSFRKPLIILLTIPLGLIGVILGLLLTGSYFGFMPFLGIISLAGIVINNAIVLIDRIQIEMDEFKRTQQDAIVAAAQQRFRPIMLTTATTTLGLIPLWIGGGVIWEPMAITIIFGLLFATILTLLVVPVMYRLFFKVPAP